MCYPVCGMMHIKEPLLLIGKSRPFGGSGCPLSLSCFYTLIYYSVLTLNLSTRTLVSAYVSLDVLRLPNDLYVPSSIFRTMLLCIMRD